MTTDTLSKIKKLLTLANNSGATEGEAQAALRRVAALAAKYNISDVEINKAVREDGTEGVRIEVNPKDMVEQVLHTAVNITRWDSWLASVVAKVVPVGVYLGSERYQTALKIYGLPQDVAVAAELWTYLRKSLSKNARGFMRHAKLDRPWITSGGVEHRTYKDGFVMGLFDVAKEKKAPEKTEVAVGATMALVLTSDIQEAKKTALATKERSLGLRTGRSRGARTHSGHNDYGRGRRDGQRTDLGTRRIA